MARKLALGDEIEAWCTKCKQDRLHHVETMRKDGRPSKVICQTCEGSHLYRKPKGPDGESAPKKKKKTKSKKASSKKKTAETFTEADAAAAKPYAMDGEFAQGDVIKHVKFGLGRVSEVRPRGRMVVAFEDGERLLVCKEAPPPGRKRSTLARAVVAAASSPASSDDSSDDDAAEGDDDASGGSGEEE